MVKPPRIAMKTIWLSLLPLPAILLAGSGLLAAGSGDPSALTAEEKSRVEAVLKPAKDFSKAERYEALQAGAATSIEDPDRLAFSHFSANLPEDRRMDFKLGNALFRKIWVPAPSSTQASDGLGPFFNARSCEQCHKDDGRGRPPEGTDRGTLFLRLARPAVTEADRARVADGRMPNLSDPVYGSQLQDQAISGVKAEGQVKITYHEQPFTFPDGMTVSLRKPVYAVDALRYGPLDPSTTLSPRIAPPMIGLGLIEAIPNDQLEAHADPDDADGDGISGMIQWVRGLDGKRAIGRFGWKAEHASIDDQTAQAFAGDLGISTPFLDLPHGDCTSAQKDCLAMATGEQARLGKSEAPDPIIGLVTHYARHLAVPARRHSGDADVLKGKQLFYTAGCIACHTPKYVTAKDAAFKEFRFQLIWPYSDFLLHDMGEGLADGQQVGGATGREWRTPALWGIGLTSTVSRKTYFLHDGRAGTLEEAILWHGGEAANARTNYAILSHAERAQMIAFLESL